VKNIVKKSQLVPSLVKLNSVLGHTKDFKNRMCCFSCFNAQHLRVSQRVKKQSVDFTSVKEKLLQTWRYKTLAVIKRHKNHLFFCDAKELVNCLFEIK